jgi:hypothetical protein
VCDILMADLPPNIGCFDEKRFLLVIPSSLTPGERTALARKIFEDAGMEQDDDEVVCPCGLIAEFPREARARFSFAHVSEGYRYWLTWAAAIVLWTGGTVALSLAGLR